MSGRRMVAATVAFVALVLWVVIFLPPSVDQIAIGLILLTAPAITLFAVIYSVTTPWYREPIGRALFISSWGLALLVDVSLAYQAFGDNYPLRDAVRITVFALICAGAWLKLIALGIEKHHARSDRRSDVIRRDPTDWER